MNWKAIAITFMILFFLQLGFMIYAVNLAIEMENYEYDCAINVCGNYDSYSYDEYENVCYCWENNDIVKEKFMG